MEQRNVLHRLAVGASFGMHLLVAEDRDHPQIGLAVDPLRPETTVGLEEAEANVRDRWQPRPVVADREIKSISVEDTFPVDVVDGSQLVSELDMLARRLAGRLRSRERSGRTVTLKVRRHDFTTIARSVTLPGPTDNETVITDVAGCLLESVEVEGGVRLLGIGVSSLAEMVHQDLFDSTATDGSPAREAPAEEPAVSWFPGCDVVHDRLG